MGHSINNRWRLKNKIRDLINAKLIQLDFVALRTLNVVTNPLPNHGPVINMVITEEPEPVIDLDELLITLQQIAWN